MQPYFLPSLVYFHLVAAADVFVFFDDVQFVTKRWTHRNRIVVNGAEHAFTVPLAGRSQSKRLTEIRVHPDEYPRWRDKFLATCAQAYAGAPRADEVLPGLAEVLAEEDVTIAALAERSVRWAASHMGLAPGFLRSSELDYDREAGRAGKIVSLCEAIGARDYVNAAGGRALYDDADFAPSGIALRFIEPEPLPAPYGAASVLHAMMHLLPTALADLAGRYRIAAKEAA